ncbi:hypothetical protein [Micromonospora sp. NPDC005367]|uniref:hypothetical protein n=1 Tax=Micromonospora sp. NPDC005367 TaxID=3155590 RepID=UPI0033BDBD9A
MGVTVEKHCWLRRLVQLANTKRVLVEGLGVSLGIYRDEAQRERVFQAAVKGLAAR